MATAGARSVSPHACHFVDCAGLAGRSAAGGSVSSVCPNLHWQIWSRSPQPLRGVGALGRPGGAMLDRIKASLPSLAPAEQRVGRLVLGDPRAFANLPVSELAARAHVGKPRVGRFCRSIGYDGLSDFKLKLAGSVSEGVPFIHRSVDADDKTGDVLVKVLDNTVAAFLKYRNDASSFAIEKAVEALASTYKTGRRIEFYGVGNSGIVAQDAQHKFFRLGVNTIAYSDGHMQVMS